MRIPINEWTDKEVEAHWDRVAHRYVRENERVKATHDQRFHAGVSRIDLREGHRVLNITSRDGEAGDYLERACPGCEVLHAEISGRLQDVARSMRPGIRQVKIGGYSVLPFRTGEFDRILSLETLEHVAEPLAFLSELHRVSAPGARMVLTCPPATSEFPYRVYTFLFGGHGEGPHRFPPSRRVKHMLERTGWNLLEHKGTVLLPVGPAWLRRAGESLIRRFQHTWLSELGIRQIYVCNKH
ncbi:MAG: methyltransferase domain-containing protein [Bacteroidales bacterium]